ncbi:MAG: hypothetical protein ACRETN_11580 [Nevskiales bacterium]
MSALLRPAGAPAPFQVRYSTEPVERILAAASDHLLAAVSFGGAAAPDDPCHISVHLRPLARNCVEVWTSTTPVTRGAEQGLRYASNADVLFGCLQLDERTHATLDEAAESGYRRILAFLRQHSYRHALRIWNFFPGINAQTDTGCADSERYRQFSIGRARTFDKFALFERALPAASAIGTYEPGLLVYFIAAREPGLQVENPRQVPAFQYPRQYGPTSPSFSRAQLKSWGAEAHLYISGTASVVGHESRHLDNVDAQIEEIRRNIDALLDQAAQTDPRFRGTGPEKLSLLRVYARPPHDIDAIRASVNKRFGPLPTLYLEGDICRQELLVEIEGYCCVSG